MKARLLTLAALGWAASAMAGDWTRPTVAFNPEGIEPTSGETVYLYNTVAGQFLTNGNAWNTQSSLSDKGLDFLLAESEIEDPSDPDAKLAGWSLKNLSAKNKDNKDASNKYLYQIDASYSYVDLGSLGTNTLWQFVGNGDGTYKMTVIKECNFFAEGKWFGYTSTEPTVVHTDVDPTDELYADGKEKAGIYWKILTKAQYEAQYDDYKAALKVYEAKLKLYNLLNDAEEAGVSTAAAEAVYNSATTVEELEAAFAELGKAINGVATPDNPVDVTAMYVTDANLDNRGEGWDNTFGGQNHGYQTRTDKTLEPEELACSITGFLESWSPAPTAQPDGHLTQKLTGLPSGLYRLSASVAATLQGHETTEIKGVYLFGDGGIRAQVACSSHDVTKSEGGVPKRYSVEFAVLEREATIGVEIQGTNANWVSCDDFQLEYLGTDYGTPYFTAMQQSLDELDGLKAAEHEEGGYLYSAATEKEVLALIAEAEQLTESSDPDVCKTVWEKLKDMIATVKAERKAYADLADLVKNVEEDTAGKFDDFPQLNQAVSDFYEVISTAYEEGTYSIEDIKAAQEQYTTIINEGIRAELEPGKEITSLLKNTTFDKENANGWQGTVDKLKFGYGAAEAYQTKFDIYQDMEGLPDGLYRIKVNGFERTANATASWPTYQNNEEVINAFIYGKSGDAEKVTPFVSAYKGGGDMNIFLKAANDGKETGYTGQAEKDGVTYNYYESNPAPGEWPYDTSVDKEDGTLLWIPNSLQGFALRQEYYPEAYATEATCVVTNGKLRIGLKCTADNNGKDGEWGQWVIFDNIKLFYEGETPDAYDDVIADLRGKLDQKYNDYVTEMPLPADIASQVEELSAKEYATAEVAKTLISELTAMLTTLDEIAAEVKKQTKMYGYYASKVYDVQSSYTEYPTWLDEIATNYDAGVTWESVEAMRQEAKKLVADWTKFVTADAAGATEEVPVDVSDVIVNRGFSEGDLAGEDKSYSSYGWTCVEGEKGGWISNADNESEHEFYNMDFDFFQTITALPAGYYEMRVQGFNRMGEIEPALEAYKANEKINARIYADNGTEVYEQPMLSIFADAQKAPLTSTDEKNAEIEGETYYFPQTMTGARAYFDAISEGEGYYNNKVQFAVTEGANVTLGVRKDKHEGGDWTIFDNFQLFYLGTTTPTAIEAVAAKGLGLAAKQAYYTIGGVQLARPQRGVNIVVTTLGDGTTMTAKVVVK